ncbi:MAG TPA: histidine kinase [Oscillospiraceae bacterium]|nr:histidine kinase [Oscillospiraceae bacterium]HPF56185.1 histidine kinase [Clostridiales bacterium]HPK36476.1 histidine kinase [Oscillospiraceae bacterium]HPR75774.1 histidine kinase [Oscillospiraceae bacterium]
MDNGKRGKSKAKKATLKGKLIFVVILICLVQLLFLSAGYIFVYGSINERSKRHIENAFSTTVDFVDSIEAYTDNLAEIIGRNVDFDYITQDNLRLEPLASNTQMDRAYYMLQMAVADPRLDEAGLYFPDEYISISSYLGVSLDNDSTNSKEYALYNLYIISIENTFFNYTDEFTGKTSVYYMYKMPAIGTISKEAYLYLRVADDFFGAAMNNNTSGVDGEFVTLVQGGTVLFSTDTENGANGILMKALADEKTGSTKIVSANGIRYFTYIENDNSGSLKAIYAAPAANYYSEMYRFLAVAGICLVLDILVWIFFARSLIIKTVYDPVMDLVSRLEKIQNNDYDVIQKEFEEREWDEVTRVFNMMVRKIKANINDSYQKDLLMKSMELKFLQSQINPHFLYNTLDSIAYKANAGEIVDVNRITGYLSKMYRLVFNKGNDFLSVGDVLLCCEMYLKICEFKYSNFEFRIESQDDIQDIEMLNLIVQTIVENAVVHGFDSSRKKFIILIRARREEEKLVFEIIDNGKGINKNRLEVFEQLLADENARSESGLVNAQKRIQLYYGNQYGIKIKSRQGKYTKVTVTMAVEKPQPVVHQLEDFEGEEEDDV